MSDVQPRLIPLSAAELELLAWLAAWTPEVARADWDRRKRWPPGYREVADTSVVRAMDDATIRARLAAPPSRRSLAMLPRLVAYRFVEGTPWSRVARITRRGRAALLHHGRPAPAAFASHLPELFDDVDLRPIVDDDLFHVGSDEWREHGYHGKLPDEPATWELLLREYREAAQGGHASGTPTAIMTIASGSTALPGSLRMHSRYVHLQIYDASHRYVCAASFSLETLTDLLVGMSEVPVALDYYTDCMGMEQAWIAPPPVSVADRMQARIEATQSERDKALLALRAQIAEAKIGKRLQAELLQGVALAMTREGDTAFRVKQAEEEISATVEAALSIAQERLGGALPVAGARAALGLLPGAAPALPALADDEGEGA